MEGEPAESHLLLLCLPLQHGLVEPHGVLVVVVAAEQSHAQYFPAAVHGSHPPHGHPCTQAVEVSAWQEVGPQQGVGGQTAGCDADPPGPAATALGVMILPGGALEEVQHFEDSLLSVSLVEEEGDGQRWVTWDF